MAVRRARLTTVAMLSVGLIALAAAAYVAFRPGSRNQQRVVWSSDFSRDNFTGWTWWGQTQSSIWGHVSVVRPQSVGVPKLFGDYIGQFQTTTTDLAHGRYNAKLYKYFQAKGHNPRSPSNVSGSYSAWYYLPRDFTMQPQKWINLFQFKELYRRPDGSSHSDPLWWVQLGTVAWAKTYPGASWITPVPARSDAPVMFLNHWNNRWTRHVVFAAVPLGRWFEISADVHQGSSIDFHLDGHRFDIARATQYPVSPFHPHSEAWIFGVGDYGNVDAGPLYVGGASLREPPNG